MNGKSKIEEVENVVMNDGEFMNADDITKQRNEARRQYRRTRH
jgi:hypothetical protein